MNLLFYLSFFLFLFSGIEIAEAIPPPDFLFNVASQFIQIFSIVFLFLSSIALSLSRFLKVYFYRILNRKFFWIFLIIVLLLVSGIIAYIYDQYQQQRVYQQRML